MTEPAELDRLTKLRVVREFYAHQLARLDATIQALEEEQRLEERRRQAAARALAFQLEPSRAQSEERYAVLHRGDCPQYRAKLGMLNEQEARVALTEEDPPVRCCTVCRPEDALRS